MHLRIDKRYGSKQKFPFYDKNLVLCETYFDNLDFTDASLHVASVIFTWRKQKVFWAGRDTVGWSVQNVIMHSLEYKWQNWQYIKKTNRINSSFHRDGKPTDLTSPTWGRRRGRMRSQSRPNLTRSPRRRHPENVCILSSRLTWRPWHSTPVCFCWKPWC